MSVAVGLTAVSRYESRSGSGTEYFVIGHDYSCCPEVR